MLQYHKVNMATSSKKARLSFQSDEELQLFLDDIESDFSDLDSSSDDSGT